MHDAADLTLAPPGDPLDPASRGIAGRTGPVPVVTGTSASAGPLLSSPEGEGRPTPPEELT